jgi:ATP-binding cassette subfamily F protein uup
MALLGMQDISIAFGGPPILDRARFALERGERVCLLGRNGAGKSTIMKLLDGTMSPNSGEIVRQTGVSVTRLEQEVPDDVDGTMFDVVAQGLGDAGLLLARYHQASHDVGVNATDAALRELDRLHHALDAANAWEMQSRVDTVLEHLGLEADAPFALASGGRKRQALLARALVRQPDVLLLDEPTNHLDVGAVEWMEQFLIQARRTRNEGRVRSLEALRVERGDRRERTGTVKLNAQEGERSGKLVVEARGVTFSRGERAIVKDFTTTITRGDRVGLIGPNGSGKTTLLRLLLGELPPDSGTIRIGTNIELAYFDQLREQLDPERSVFDSIADGADWIDVASGGQKHVLSYLQDFLFSPDRARTPVRALSGGERNRLLLARLFTRSFNMLVLDEPTNDLDIETLDLLEELLLEFSGTLLVVSHDRAFLDNVVTSTLVFEGGGRIGEYVGGYQDWVRQRNAAVSSQAPVVAKKSPTSATTKGAKGAPADKKKKRLSFKEQTELAELPDRIDAAERDREKVYLSLSDPAVLRDGAAISQANARVAAIDVEIKRLTERWETLETLNAS